MDPIDLFQNSLDSISTRGRFTSPCRKADQNRYIGLRLASRDDPVDKPDTSAGNRTDIRSALGKQRTDEALSFQPESARKLFEGPALIGRKFTHITNSSRADLLTAFRVANR